MHWRWMILALLTAFFGGCATGTKLVTGPARPATAPEAVQLFTTPPAKYEIIGMVEARSRGRHQSALDRAVKELRQQAAKIGANGVLLSGAPQPTGGGLLGAGRSTRVSGQAVFVTEPAR